MAFAEAVPQFDEMRNLLRARVAIPPQGGDDAQLELF